MTIQDNIPAGRCETAVWHGETLGECGQELGRNGQCPDHPADDVVDAEILDAPGTEYLGFVIGRDGVIINAGLEDGAVAFYLTTWLNGPSISLDGAQQRQFRDLFDTCCERAAGVQS
jgi:hypothetical protein